MMKFLRCITGRSRRAKEAEMMRDESRARAAAAQKQIEEKRLHIEALVSQLKKDSPA